jgi:hypothetical protein
MSDEVLKPDPVTVTPSQTFTNAQFATGGVSLRNKKGGVINISGVTGGIKAAYLYWAYIVANNSMPPLTQRPSFCSITPTSSGIGNVCIGTVTGNLVAYGRDPCWVQSSPYGQIVVYRADVKNTVQTTSGNGAYSIGLPLNTYSTSNGSNPWTTTSFPAAEGASLVVVGTETGKTVEIFDVGIAGKTFNKETFTYTLNFAPLPSSPIVNSDVQWDNIGADGQIGIGRSVFVTPTIKSTQETVTAGGSPISGPGSQLNDSDWDGSSGWPLPQLWDDTGHVIPLSALSPDRKNLIIQQHSNGDCVTPIANVVSFTGSVAP